MLSVPQSDTKSTEGLLDATPIILEGVLARDFEAILELISSPEDQSKIVYVFTYCIQGFRIFIQRLTLNTASRTSP